MSSPDVLNLSIASNAREWSSIPSLLLSFSFLFLYEIVLVLQRGKFTEGQWNIVCSEPYTVFISAPFYYPLRKPGIISIFIFFFLGFSHFSLLLWYFSRPRNRYKIAWASWTNVRSCDTGMRWTSINFHLKMSSLFRRTSRLSNFFFYPSLLASSR